MLPSREKNKNEDECTVLYLDSPVSVTADYWSETSSPASVNKKSGFQGTCYRRVVRKSGSCNVLKKESNGNSRKNISIHFQDMFTSMVELRWRWIFFIFSLCQVLSWYLFALLWWAIAYNHGDLSYSNKKNSYNDGEPCVIGVTDFASSFLFSMETQYTTGFGTRVPTAQCPEAIFLISLQNIIGAIITSITLGIIFTKAARPTARKAAILFSEKAVVCTRNGKLRLLFRIADVRKSKIISSEVKAWFLSSHKTSEGEYIPHYHRKLNLSIEDAGTDVCLLWPLTVCHTIDNSSPFFEMSALDVMESNFEIIVTLTGTLETTGQSIEAKTSYIPSEIMWGHQFVPVFVKLSKWKCGYIVDYSKFQQTRVIDTPTCSAKQMLEYSNPNSPTWLSRSYENMGKVQKCL